MKLPMPSENHHGGTVIASQWMNDDDSDGYAISYRVIVLHTEAPYYSLVEVADGTVSWVERFVNIADAVTEYNG